MGSRTRSSAASSPSEAQSVPKSPAAPEESLPLKLFVLPKYNSSAARFILLKHPHDGIKRRFYFCPKNALYEFKKINAPTTDLRSILFTSSDANPPTGNLEAQMPTYLQDESEGVGPQQPAGTVDVTSGYVNKAAEIFIATPFDMVFILIPLLSAQGVSTKTHTGKALFQPLDDMLDPYLGGDKHLRYVLENGRRALEDAAAKICDTVEAGDEKMFRINEDKLLKAILDKAQSAVRSGLPASLEERFVTRALEKPILHIKREESSSSVTTAAFDVESSGGSFGVADSQCNAVVSAASTAASELSVATTMAHNEDEAIPEEIINLQRLRTAWSFIMASYLTSQLGDRLTGLLSSKQSPISFAPLERYLLHLATLRTEALALQSLSGFGQKRGLDDSGESAAREEKKRKQDEQEKRKKAGESRGVRDLKKVDVSGMKKMSAFFTKTSTMKVKS